MSIVIYSKDECSFCDRARELLKSLGKEYIEYKLEKDFTRETLKAVFPSAKTFPVITIDNSYIGGYNELSEIAKEGKL
jgi:glutaredoxin